MAERDGAMEGGKKICTRPNEFPRRREARYLLWSKISSLFNALLVSSYQNLQLYVNDIRLTRRIVSVISSEWLSTRGEGSKLRAETMHPLCIEAKKVRSLFQKICKS